MPSLTVTASTEEAATLAAQKIADVLQAKPATLGLATGNTMTSVYQHLVKMHTEGEVSFSRAKSFNLDEYWPCAPENPTSFAHFMEENLFRSVDLPAGKGRVLLGDCNEHEVDVICTSWERMISEAGGIDLQILGIGRNGHIAFNEPGSSIESRTRLVELAESTIEANGFSGTNGHPTHALTMGIGTILEARRILVLATGESKRNAVEAALKGPISEECPASLLRTHPRVEWILDPAAAGNALAPNS